MPSPAPHEAALGVLSAILLKPSTIDSVAPLVIAPDFADPHHGDLFALLVDMHHAGQSVGDHRLVLNRVRDSGLLESLGGPRQFQADFLNAGATENAAFYANHVRIDSVRRDLIDLSVRFERDAKSGDDPKSTASSFRAELDAIESRATPDGHTSTIGKACESFVADMRATIEAGVQHGIETGIDHLDSNYGGLFPGRLYVIAARPAVGKSSLAQQIGEHIAANTSATLFVSLEMPEAEVAARYLAKVTKINAKHLTAHTVSDTELERCDTAATNATRPFHISTPTRATAATICAEARVWKATHSIRVLIIDYLQILDASNPRQREYDKITEATRAFKQLSRELEIPVVLLSQLSRDNEKQGREPRLSDLRSSGSIEQDSDCVILLHDTGSNQIKLTVAKMRGGERSETTLRFDGPTCQFLPPEIEDHPNYNSDLKDF